MPEPSFSVLQNEDGTVTTTAVHAVGALNWAALIQAIIAAAPSILAILQAFASGATPPPPAPFCTRKNIRENPGPTMPVWPKYLCYTASAIVVFSAMSERDILEWTGVVIAAGATMFAWGLGRYHDFRKQRRDEDRQDRSDLLEDIRAHTRLLCEIESRQDRLTKALASITIEIEKQGDHLARERNHGRNYNEPGATPQTD